MWRLSKSAKRKDVITIFKWSLSTAFMPNWLYRIYIRFTPSAFPRRNPNTECLRFPDDSDMQSGLGIIVLKWWSGINQNVKYTQNFDCTDLNSLLSCVYVFILPRTWRTQPSPWILSQNIILSKFCWKIRIKSCLRMWILPKRRWVAEGTGFHINGVPHEESVLSVYGLGQFWNIVSTH